MTITDVLNMWDQMGVFAYLIPFLLIFAVTFAILEKSRILHSKDGNDKLVANRPLLAIIAAAVGLLALQLDYVSNFFTVIFPRFGIGLAMFLVFLIFIGFFWNGRDDHGGGLKFIAWLVAIGVVVWAFSNWSYWGLGGGAFELGWWLNEYFWSIIILAGVVGLIYMAARDPSPRGNPGGRP